MAASSTRSTPLAVPARPPVVACSRARRPRAPFSVVEHSPPVDALDSDYPLLLTTGAGVLQHRQPSPTATARRCTRARHRACRPRTPRRWSSKRERSSRSPAAADRSRRRCASRPAAGLAFMTLHFPDQVDTNQLTIDATDPKSGGPRSSRRRRSEWRRSTIPSRTRRRPRRPSRGWGTSGPSGDPAHPWTGAAGAWRRPRRLTCQRHASPAASLPGIRLHPAHGRAGSPEEPLTWICAFSSPSPRTRSARRSTRFSARPAAPGRAGCGWPTSTGARPSAGTRRARSATCCCRRCTRSRSAPAGSARAA